MLLLINEWAKNLVKIPESRSFLLELEELKFLIINRKI